MNDDSRDEEEELRRVTLQNAHSIQLARQRAERRLLEAKEELERKNAELREQREWFEVTLSSIGDAVVTTDVEERITFLNPVAEQMTGWKKDEAVGRRLAEVVVLVHERTRRPAVNPVDIVLRKGKVVGIANHTALIGRDGRETAIEDSAAPIRDSEGLIIGAVMVFHDVGEKRRAAQALREESRALEILNRTGAAIASNLDLESAVQAVTDSATQLTGAGFGAFFYNIPDENGEAYLLYSLSGADRKDFEGLGHPRATPLFGPTFRGEGVIRSDDVLADPRYGQWGPHHGMPKGHLPVRSYLAVPVISHSGEVIGGLFFGHEDTAVFTERDERIVSGIAAHAAIAVDNARLYESAQREIVSRQKAEEALRVADRRKDEFLATLAHELRNPLAPIRQAARIWQENKVTAEQLRWSHEVVERQSRHMAMLLDDLLDIARITQGQMALRKEDCLLADIVDAAVETASPLIEERRHSLEVDLPDQPLRLVADPLRLAQVIANLLTNAAKYTEAGGRIELRGRRKGKEVMIEVSDTGMGIESAMLPHIFEMFSQTRPPIDRKEEGLGIGLALVKGLVSLHGGRVEAESPGAGRGSRFTLHLPAGPAAATAPGGDAEGEEDARTSVRRILIADDNHDMADSLAMFLRLHGHEVQVVYHGEAALEACEQRLPDYAILDIGMPRLNGYEAARRIRGLPGGEKVTLVALTGWGQAQDKENAVEAGFDQHFTKPVDLEELLALLQST